MDTKSLRYFRYVLKYKLGTLLASFAVPAIIPKTTAIHPCLNQLARAKYKRIYFAVPVDFLGVLAVVAKNLIIIFKLVRTNSLVQAILRIYVNWRSYPRAIARAELGMFVVTSFSGQDIAYCCSIAILGIFALSFF
jgi:hypothetical protein